MPTTSPRIAKFPSTTIQWSDATNFNGFILISLVPSTLSGTTYTEGDFGYISPTEVLPAFAVIPIQNGLINQSLGLYFSVDISPPNTTYIARFYDTTKRLISGPSVAFSVTADPISTLTIPSLTTPSAGGTAPVPN